MKVLLVTHQVIEDTGSSYRCSANMFYIIRRFTRLGSLSICAIRYKGNNSHTKIECDLTGIVPYGQVSFVSKDYVFMSKRNKLIIEDIVRNVDLVISHSSSYDVWRLAQRYGKRFMSFVGSCAWDAYWNHGWKGKMLAPYKFLRARYTIAHSDYVLYVSNQFLQQRYPTHARFQCGCSNVRIPTLDESTLKKRLDFINHWEGDELHIATTAAVDVRYKGQQYVLKAMSILKQQGHTKIHYYLLGGGNQCYLRKLVDKYGLEQQVHFLGIVPHDEIFTVLDKMHVYIQPSLQEGLPRAMVEAMSRGLMCIGANTAAIPELIEPQFVTRRKSSDDIAQLLSSVNREQLIEQARRNFKEAYSYEEATLDVRRNNFFDKIVNDIQAE